MANEPLPTASHRGLLGSASHLLTVLVAAAETRVGILASELQEERVRLGRLLMVGAAALFCLGLGTVLLSVFLVVLYWDSDRLAVLGLLSGLFLGLGVVSAIVLAVISRSPKRPLHDTVEVLAKDRESLEQHS
ncbi:MAG TPA: phage holin family protein [Polyangia bacterium]|jgi:Predicted membrane protein|nr:phage holin family protein [Polyangia bacterium]